MKRKFVAPSSWWSPQIGARKLKARDKAARTFESNISPEPNTGCWLWVGNLQSNGYGRIGFASGSILAHRFSYERFVAPIPEGLTIDHLCRVCCCVNPDHLEPVTNAENIRRSHLANPRRRVAP